MSERTDNQAANGPADTDAPPREGAESAAPESGVAGADAAQGAAEGGEGERGEVEALRERYLRLAAEYENYRKRTERERAESWTRAQGQLVQQLLDALDDLQRVADFNAETASVQAILEGVQMVERKLFRTLEGAGLEVLDASGKPFDPAVHDALMTAPTESREEDDTVGQVFQPGYRFKGDLLRPARVQVRKHGG